MTKIRTKTTMEGTTVEVVVDNNSNKKRKNNMLKMIKNFFELLNKGTKE